MPSARYLEGMGSLRERFEGFWNGRIDPDVDTPFAPLLVRDEVADRALFVSSFANVTVFRTDAGLLLFDVGSPMLGAQVHGLVREWSRDPAHTVVFSHGHIDHVFGVDRFEADAKKAKAPAPRVVAHERVPARFERYKKSRGYNACANTRQYQSKIDWPAEFRAPDQTYRDTLVLDVGGLRVELEHARGETDDATWAWVPSRGALCTGDLFIWAVPNAGNPQKTQRYPVDWAKALRRMARKDAEVLCPGHGVPIWGKDNVRRALVETAELLESIHEQTLAVMNDGGRLDDALHAVKAPPHLLERPYLRPIYDEPEFLVRAVWRHYGGWWDGSPASLKPAPRADLGAEVAALAGGPTVLCRRAEELLAEGRADLACHLVELAADAAPHDEEVFRVRRKVYTRREREATSLMAKGIYAAAAQEKAKPRG